MDSAGQRLKVAAICSRLDGDDLSVLLKVAERIELGRKTYKQFDLRNDKRNFVQEALEEHLDAIVYLAADSVRRLRG